MPQGRYTDADLAPASKPPQPSGAPTGTTFTDADLATRAAEPERATDSVRDKMSGVLNTAIGPGAEDVVVGIMKGAANTAVGLGELVHRIPGVSAAIDAFYGTPGLSAAAFPAARQATEAKNPGEQVGRMAEQLGEFFLPTGIGGRLGKAAEVLKASGLTLAQTGSVDDAAIQGGLTAGLGVLVPKAAGLLRTKLPPAGQAAVAFGLREGVPVDPATASGNRFVKNIQAGAANTPLGAVVAEHATAAQGEAMTATGQRLAARTTPSAVTPEQAGEGLRATIRRRMGDFKDAADAAYERLRQIEARPANQSSISGPAKTTTSTLVGASGQPITTTIIPATTMQAAVDMRPVKAALKPLYERLLRQMPLAQRQASYGLLAMENIINGADHMALSDADASLGAIKSLARTDLPEARSVSQGLAASAVTALEKAVSAKATALGPDAVAALQEGRAATIANYAAKDVFETLHAEPVRAYGQAVAARDAGIANLREAIRLAPNSAKQIGRAWIDAAMDKATAEGGFQRAQGLWADWERLGAETKQLLFGQALTGDLDKFFMLGKKLAEQPNPSKTALTLLSVTSGGLLFTEPVTGTAVILGTGALAKALYSPRFVRAMTHGFQMPIRNGAAAVAAARELMNAAVAAGAPISKDSDQMEPDVRQQVAPVGRQSLAQPTGAVR